MPEIQTGRHDLESRYLDKPANQPMDTSLSSTIQTSLLNVESLSESQDLLSHQYLFHLSHPSLDAIWVIMTPDQLHEEHLVELFQCRIMHLQVLDPVRTSQGNITVDDSKPNIEGISIEFAPYSDPNLSKVNSIHGDMRSTIEYKDCRVRTGVLPKNLLSADTESAQEPSSTCSLPFGFLSLPFRFPKRRRLI